MLELLDSKKSGGMFSEEIKKLVERMVWFHDECACEPWCDDEESRVSDGRGGCRILSSSEKRELEKLAEEHKKKRRIEKRFIQSLMMLEEKTMREARAGPLLPLQKK
ncbi:hypothetical protein ACVNSY_18400 [Bacillus sp. OHL2]